MVNDNLYFLSISGTVNREKHQEFQQTVQFIFNHLPTDCLSKSLSLDVGEPNRYYIFSQWSTEDSLQSFKTSYSFEMLKGAFQTLGSYHETMSGSRATFQLFELDHLDY